MAIPPSWIIQTGRSIWTQIWQLMMSQLAPRDDRGEYQRPQSEFRQHIEGIYIPQPNRYRLYVGWSCPWAHRTLVVRALKGLEGAIDVTLLQGDANAGGWRLPEPAHGCQTLAELYRYGKTGYTGRSTVPMLWDTQTYSIVNNESAEIIEILNSEFNEYAAHPDLDLAPDDLQDAIYRWNETIYHTVNNGVYRCGFAQTQTAYDRAYRELFATLDRIDNLLANQAYLCGDRLTLADVRLFTTLIRFDLVYHTLFKCNRRRIRDYPQLQDYVYRIYHLPGVAATCDFPTILADYYGNLFPLNPGGIIPQLPDLSYLIDRREVQTI
ncbi:glutathione S-transferase family protein [Chamaesiphon minutus]|uniref:Putative glutathione S-transferase n=1 Tax=Chamaesiphon minutus (strain ATCC 27169 / PCC 6605) TaxID=1173020 RepID=K9UNJ9_CHAP6|nr:glutathione S-transferase C-terminal domain-containing protein [Chamaesiphon minutus]AFY96385.1 putative glutathione S-transferase [Chamaesiphon minutus PCC 6605]